MRQQQRRTSTATVAAVPCCRSLQPANACLGGLPPAGVFPATQKFAVLGYTAIATVIKALPLSASINQTACILLNEKLINKALTSTSG